MAVDNYGRYSDDDSFESCSDSETESKEWEQQEGAFQQSFASKSEPRSDFEHSLGESLSQSL